MAFMPLSRAYSSWIRSHSMCSKPGSDFKAQPSTAALESKKYLDAFHQRVLPTISEPDVLHGIQAENRQFFGDNLDPKPASPLKDMALIFRNELLPNTAER